MGQIVEIIPKPDVGIGLLLLSAILRHDLPYLFGFFVLTNSFESRGKMLFCFTLMTQIISVIKSNLSTIDYGAMSTAFLK